MNLTAVGSAVTNGSGQSVRMYYLVAPSSGTNTVAVVFSGSFPSETHVVASSFTGVHQTTPLGTQATSQSASVNVSATASQDLVVDAVLHNGTQSFGNPGADQGKLRESLGTVFSGAMSAEHARGSSVTMSWNQGSAIVGVALKPATTAPAGTVETVPQPFRWASVLYDAETGLYKMGARYYDPSIGRFLQPDPIAPNWADPTTWDPYAYAGCNPITNTDPTGLCTKSSAGAIFAGGLTGVALSLSPLNVFKKATWTTRNVKAAAGGISAGFEFDMFSVATSGGDKFLALMGTASAVTAVGSFFGPWGMLVAAAPSIGVMVYAGYCRRWGS